MGAWIDVFPLGDGFGRVESDPGVIKVYKDEALLWERLVPETDILRHIRGAASPEGVVLVVGQGGDNNAWLVSPSGVSNVGVAAGQDPVAILHDGQGFVIYRTVSGTEYEIDKAGRTTLHSMPLTSQGIREVYPEGGIDFGDSFLTETKIQGYTFWRRTQKLGFVGGQSANGKGEGLGLLELATGKYMWFGPFTMAESPHFAVNGDKVAIAAYTNEGARYKVWTRPFPHEPVFVPEQPKPDDPIKPPVETPKDPPMSKAFPAKEWAVVKEMHERFAGDFPATEDGAREWTRKTIEQLAFSFPGGGWCWKKGGEHNPPSKDCIARQVGVFEGWDTLSGAGVNGPRILADPPAYHELTGQVPIPVTPTNHLRKDDPKPDDPDVDDPDTDEPDTPGDEPKLEDLADLIATAIAKSLEARLEDMFAEINKKLDRPYEAKLFGSKITLKPVNK